MAGQPKTMVVVNPASAGGRARQLRPAIVEYFAKHRRNAAFVETTSAEETRELSRVAASRGFGFVVALGGDGTFHHVVAGGFGTPVIFGFIPAGHGNDIATGLGIPTDPMAAAHDFLRHMERPHRFDVIRARFAGGGERVFVGAGGLGLDAEAAALANSRFRRWPGALRYVLGALWTLKGFRPIPLDVQLQRVEGAGAESWQGEVLFAAVANGPGYGAGVKIAHRARMNDGLLDMTLVEPMPWNELLEALLVVLRHGDVRSRKIRRFRALSVRLTPGRKALFHGDGEILGEIGASGSLELEVLPSSILVAARAPAPEEAGA